MKKKYLLLLGLGCGALFLTGCGGSAKELKCVQEDKESGSKMEMVVEFNDDETKVEKATVTMVADLSEAGEELAALVKENPDMLKSMFCTESDDCDVKLDGNTVTAKYSVTEFDEEDQGSKADIKKELEDEGFSCK